MQSDEINGDGSQMGGGSKGRHPNHLDHSDDRETLPSMIRSALRDTHVNTFTSRRHLSALFHFLLLLRRKNQPLDEVIV
jgi:hypothetical protein